MARINERHMLPIGTALNGGEYVIRRHLSCGGFGNTYLAEVVNLGREVAIKEFFMKDIAMRDKHTKTVRPIDPDDPEKVTMLAAMREKFKKEARRIVHLDNPHIVRVYRLFDENGTSYYEMDYVSGGSVADRVKRHVPMSERDAAALALQVVDALVTVHAHHILHLDIKPDNILLDEKGNAKLIDFGASKIREASDGTTTMISYSQGYAPPEQAEGNREAFGTWTDIYALGATLYFMLTGSTPPKHYAIREKGLHLPPAVSPGMSDVISRMMSLNRSERPELEKVKAMLEDFANDEETKVLPTERNRAKPIENNIEEDKTKALPNNPNHATLQRVLRELEQDMVWVEGGTFTMGATSEQGSDADSDDEKPAHRVTLDGFSICKHEVTQELWEAVMGSNPSRFKGSRRPVEQVSWDDCKEFISKLNALTGKSYRLPTEAEWEYAARGGNRSRGYKYSSGNDIGSVAWYYYNSYNKGSSSPDYGTHDVGGKAPNELGLYDMSGNVWEWCEDWYGSYSSAPQTNPTGPASASFRVSRGGSWLNRARSCRVSNRDCYHPDSRYNNLGLRLAQ